MGRQEPIREVRRSITGIGRAPEQAHGTDRRAYEDAESTDRTSAGLATAEERGTVELQRRRSPAFMTQIGQTALQRDEKRKPIRV